MADPREEGWFRRSGGGQVFIGGEPPGHHADEGEVNEGFMVARVLLVITGEAALLDQPAEAALDHPAPWQHDEAFLVFEFLDDAQGEVRAHAEEPAHVRNELFELSGVAAVGEDHQQAHQVVAKEAQEHFGSVAILHARRCDHHAEEQAVGVGQSVALAPFDLFACVVAAARGGELPAFDALAVDDPGAGRGVFFSVSTRTRSRSAVLMRGQTPCSVQVARASCTVLLGGKSLGNNDHWQPALRM